MEPENKEKLEKEQKEVADKKAGCCKRSNHTLAILIVVAIVVILGGALAVGKFAFSRHNNNERFASGKMMTGRGGMMRGKFGGQPGRQAQAGVNGEITKIDGNNVTVKRSDSTEIAVAISDTTSLSKNGEIAKQADLKVGDTIRVIGPSKSDGSVTANVIIIK